MKSCSLFTFGLFTMLFITLESNAGNSRFNSEIRHSLQDSILENERQSTLLLNIGFGNIARQDQIFSPFVHQSSSPINIGFEFRKAGNWQQLIQLKYGGYQPKKFDYTYISRSNKEERTAPNNFTFVDINYALGKKIRFSPGTLTLGGILENDIDVLAFNYGFAGSSGYFASFSLGLWTEYKHRFNTANSLTASLQLPLLAWVTRSPYLMNDDQYMKDNLSHNGGKIFFEYLSNGKLQTLNRLQKATFSLQYLNQVSTKWQLGANYTFGFLHHPDPAKLLSLNNIISLSAAYKF